MNGYLRDAQTIQARKRPGKPGISPSVSITSSGIICEQRYGIIYSIIYLTIIIQGETQFRKEDTVFNAALSAISKIVYIYRVGPTMLRWARGKTNNDHIRNEDNWTEANTKPMTTFLV